MTDALSKIRTRLEEITRALKTLTEEARELQIAERVISRLEVVTKTNGGSDPANLQLIDRAAHSRPATNKDRIIATLRTTADPWVESSAQLHTMIKNIHGVDMNYDGTFLPLLSYLKKLNIIVRKGPKIALVERAGGGVPQE